MGELLQATAHRHRTGRCRARVALHVAPIGHSARSKFACPALVALHTRMHALGASAAGRRGAARETARRPRPVMHASQYGRAEVASLAVGAGQLEPYPAQLGMHT
eukprot:CAMPEP_0181177608 /NCGR_PEP_ID=MMETSP1096-20121128/5262_1 /TAXON_ID=156174 ORGANISM="Chrysochromulina ericina, Strain CCMP281" /NCGR_SAMPLE_ID=MMETSP1096 /ASSEMBLY_ACC=CAM_ASM_000453 /LENGTH=104 /DNA_ID=CAMNT_0023265791 /DNA_START=507 /DNA_END=817 /DNA_ORIENTATION=-